MKIIHLNYSDIQGGAARAAYRIHHALRWNGVDSRMCVNNALTDDWTVQGPEDKLQKALTKVRSPLSNFLVRLLMTQNPVIHSPAIFPSGWPRRVGNYDPDILHLHWVGQEMLSIADIAKLDKPVVWTLHDMWAFCGAEHYTEDHRWKEGYNRTNRPTYEKGFDLNRWTWNRKRRHWKRPMHFVAPSNWIADCVKESALMKNWPVTVIPNAIDTDVWQPVDRSLARNLLQLPQDRLLLLFGAMGGGRDPRKGFDLLQSALNELRGEISGLELLVFGQLAPEIPLDMGFPIHYIGHLRDDVSLRLVYSAADVMVIPSRQDNLPNTGLESHACGLPVVAFDIGGLPDIVEHRKTGYLAKPFDLPELAEGIKWVLENQKRRNEMGLAARARALEMWSYELVVPQYEKVYKEALADGKK